MHYTVQKMESKSNRKSQQAYVELNVGGTHYTTSLSTLTRYPDSELCKIFSKNTVKLEKDSKGRYILDRDGKVFRYILNFLRGGNLNLHLNFKEYDQLREEVKFYELKKMENLLKDWQAGKNQRINSDKQDAGNASEDIFEDITPGILDVDPESPDLDNQSEGELSDECNPTLWIMNTNPRRSPYVPQMGDEVMYFWQGHKCYADAVRKQCVYDIDGIKFPWERGDLKTEEPMRVVGIEYLTGPPITCDIKLASIDHVTKRPTGKTSQIRYYVMPEAVDFLILTQHYETSLKRKWKVGDRFRKLIGNRWWSGVINDKVPMDAGYPGSHFQCFETSLDNGESRLSPWDLEPVDGKNTPNKVGRGIPITTSEMQQLQYNPKPGEWGECDQNTECERILKYLDQLTSLKIAKTLTVPIDTSDDPDDSIVVPYPIDLKTIRERLELRFYRRRAALQWEVKQIEANATLFNEPNSEVVTSAESVTNILLEVIRNAKLNDAISLHNRMIGITDTDEKPKRKTKKRSTKIKEFSSSDEESDDSTQQPAKKRRSMRTHDETRWIEECKNLLKLMFTMDHSKPFRTPINQSIYKDYADAIEHPMDLTIVKKRMKDLQYEDPNEFAKDVRLIISNSKAYFTEKKSGEIHAMTRNFSNFFEDSIRDTLLHYKSAAAYIKLSPKIGTPSPIKNSKDSKQRSQNNLTQDDKPGPSGKQKRSKVTKALTRNDDVSDSDCDSISSAHPSSDDEWGPSGPYHDSFQDDDDDSDAKRRDKTPGRKSHRKTAGRRKTEEKKKSDETPRHKKLRKASTSSNESIFGVDFLGDSFESADAKENGEKSIIYDKNKDEDIEDDDDIDAKRRDKTPGRKSPSKTVGRRKTEGKEKSDETERQKKLRKASTSSNESISDLIF